MKHFQPGRFGGCFSEPSGCSFIKVDLEHQEQERGAPGAETHRRVLGEKSFNPAVWTPNFIFVPLVPDDSRRHMFNNPSLPLDVWMFDSLHQESSLGSLMDPDLQVITRARALQQPSGPNWNVPVDAGIVLKSLDVPPLGGEWPVAPLADSESCSTLVVTRTPPCSASCLR